MSFWIVAEMTVKPGKKAEFEALMKELMAESIKETGMNVYTLVQQAKGPKELDNKVEADKYYMIENYKSREALTAHIKSPHFQKLGTKLGQYTTSGPMKIMAPVVVSGNKL